MSTHRTLIFGSLIGAAALAGGCFSLRPTEDPTRFYVLSVGPIEGSLPAQPGPAPAIYLAPVGIPAYLDNPGIALRRGDNRVEYSRIHHWAEPLRDGVERCLREHLARLTGSEQVGGADRRRPSGDHLEVQVILSRFEIADNGTALLAARWRILQGRAGRVLHFGTTDIRRPYPATEGAFEGAVGALGGTLAELSRAIADGLKDASAP
jgi:uncharacterized lipoprotein YmbA